MTVLSDEIGQVAKIKSKTNWTPELAARARPTTPQKPVEKFHKAERLAQIVDLVIKCRFDLLTAEHYEWLEDVRYEISKWRPTKQQDEYIDRRIATIYVEHYGFTVAANIIGKHLTDLLDTPFQPVTTRASSKRKRADEPVAKREQPVIDKVQDKINDVEDIYALASAQLHGIFRGQQYNKGEDHRTYMEKAKKEVYDWLEKDSPDKVFHRVFNLYKKYETKWLKEGLEFAHTILVDKKRAGTSDALDTAVHTLIVEEIGKELARRDSDRQVKKTAEADRKGKKKATEVADVAKREQPDRKVKRKVADMADVATAAETFKRARQEQTEDTNDRNPGVLSKWSHK